MNSSSWRSPAPTGWLSSASPPICSQHPLVSARCRCSTPQSSSPQRCEGCSQVSPSPWPPPPPLSPRQSSPWWSAPSSPTAWSGSPPPPVFSPCCSSSPASPRPGTRSSGTSLPSSQSGGKRNEHRPGSLLSTPRVTAGVPHRTERSRNWTSRLKCSRNDLHLRPLAVQVDVCFDFASDIWRQIGVISLRSLFHAVILFNTLLVP